jgi:hypothetical protein
MHPNAFFAPALIPQQRSLHRIPPFLCRAPPGFDVRCRDYLVSSPIARSQEENNLRHALDLSHTNGWWQAEISALHVEIQRVESAGIEENLLLETIQIQRDDTN